MKLELLFAGIAVVFVGALMVMLGNGCATATGTARPEVADAGTMLGVDVMGEFDPAQNQVCIYVASLKRMRCLTPAEFSARMDDANDKLNARQKDDL